jgi:tetratricopeptide (TPR) repeat protein
MRHLSVFLSGLALFLTAFASLGSSQQTPPRKPPALIRDTGVAEGKAEPEAVIRKEYNPLLAERNLKVGDQYMKRRNYDAAISRYQDAIEYQPSLVAAYDALGRAFEKKGDKLKAIAVYQDFLKKYPDSSEAPKFKSRSDRLK